jgi:BirA family transcriptional regulator, biotin operon repressor / biotin---[acetyl-CoA-carboxylase] ligase
VLFRSINQTLISSALTNPVSLKQITGKNFDTKKLSEELCAVINKYYTQLLKEGFDNIYKEYNNCLYKLNEVVRLKKGNSVFQTTIAGVTGSGELITNNTVMEERFSFGEISWLI